MKHKMKSFHEHQFKSKAGWKTEHHLTPKERKGKKELSNLLSLDAYRHQAWHLLFGNKTLREIIELLERIEQIKQSKLNRG